MKEQLQEIKSRALANMQAAQDLAALDAVRVSLLGKKGELTAVLKLMGKLYTEERPVMGQMANAVRAELEAKLEERKAELEAAALEAKLAAEAIDVTIPGYYRHKFLNNVKLNVIFSKMRRLLLKN